MKLVWEETDDLQDDLPEPVIVQTGLKSWQGATRLLIHHYKGDTIVCLSGEYQNCGPLLIEGIISPEDVLADYLRDLSEMGA